MANKHSSARVLRSLLLFAVLSAAIVTVVGFYFAQNWLADNVSNSKTKNYQSVSGSLSSNDLVTLQNDVYNHQADSIKATSLIAPDATFEQIIQQDLERYASKIGVSITSINSVQAPAIEASNSKITGVETKYVSITLGNPIEFTKLFEFIQAIETSIPKIKLTGISMDSDSGQNVKVKPIIIEVYTE